MSFGFCVECKDNKEKPLANKTKKLCEKHNKKRLSSLENPTNIVKEASLTERLIKNSGIKRISDKEKINREAYLLACKEIDKRINFCTGCGNPDNLSHSHLIPRSRRKDLESTIQNLTLHCLVRKDNSEGCHSLWESMDWIKMNKLFDFNENLSRVKELDINYYNKILSQKPIEITPISDLDKKILLELDCALRIAGNLHLADIITKYKEIPDKEILHKLKEFIIEFDNLDISEDDLRSPFIKKMIPIKEDYFDVKDIKNLSKLDEYNENISNYDYYIVLNKDNTGTFGGLLNLQIKYQTEMERNWEYGILIQKLKKYGVLFL